VSGPRDAAWVSKALHQADCFLLYERQNRWQAAASVPSSRRLG
jgi:hypothetical protein